MGYHWRVTGEKVEATSIDSVDGMVVEGSAYILRFSFLI